MNGIMSVDGVRAEVPAEKLDFSWDICPPNSIV